MKKLKSIFIIIQFKLFFNSVENQIPWKNFPNFPKLSLAIKLWTNFDLYDFIPKLDPEPEELRNSWRIQEGKWNWTRHRARFFDLRKKIMAQMLILLSKCFVRYVFIQRAQEFETQTCRQQNCYVCISTFNKRNSFFFVSVSAIGRHQYYCSRRAFRRS